MPFLFSCSKNPYPFLLFIIVLVFSGCSKETVEEAVESIEVEVLRVAARDMAERFEVGGILEAEEIAVITAEISGTIQDQFFREGDRVNQEDVLLRFDREPVLLNFHAAKANLRKAEVGFENNRNEFDRRVKLNQEGFLSLEVVENARRSYRASEADLDVAKSGMNLAQRDLKKTEVRSPISGMITKRFREIGEQVPPGTPLFSVSDTHALRLVVGLSEEQVLHVKEKEAVQVKLKPFSSRIFKGHVKRIGIPASKLGGTFPAEVVLDNRDQLLKPGMICRVKFTGRQHTGIFIIPRDAIVKKLGQEIIYLVRENKAVSAKVIRGAEFGFQVAIAKGLTHGDQVVVIGQSQVYEGAPVEVRTVSAEIVP